MRGRGPPRAARAVKLNNPSAPRRSFTKTPTATTDRYSARAPEPTYGPEWAATRRQVLIRDGYTCTNRECRVVHRPPMHGKLDAHHIRAREKGGPDTVDNLRTLCKACHALEHKHLARMGYGQPKGRR